jgi:hypothetical protein
VDEPAPHGCRASPVCCIVPCCMPCLVHARPCWAACLVLACWRRGDVLSRSNLNRRAGVRHAGVCTSGCMRPACVLQACPGVHMCRPAAGHQGIRASGHQGIRASGHALIWCMHAVHAATVPAVHGTFLHACHGTPTQLLPQKQAYLDLISAADLGPWTPDPGPRTPDLLENISLCPPLGACDRLGCP